MKNKLLVFFSLLLGALYLYQRPTTPTEALLSSPTEAETSPPQVTPSTTKALRMPSSLGDSIDKKFEHDAMNMSLKLKASALHASLRIERIQSSADFVNFRWKLLGIPVEGSEERWIKDSSTQLPQLQVGSDIFNSDGQQMLSPFPQLTHTEIKTIVEDILAADQFKLLSILGEPQKLWQASVGARLLPVYEIAIRAEKNKNFIDEVWRIDSAHKKVIRRAPQSRHGSAQERGIQLKAFDHESF